MDFDLESSEHEPEEWDPESEYRDPESDWLTIPEVTTAESDVPSELLQTFWILVFVINVAVLFVALGVLFVAFRVDVELGGALLGAGAVLFGLAYRRYRTYRYGDAGEDDDPASSPKSDATADAGTGRGSPPDSETDSAVDSEPSPDESGRGE